MRLFTATSLILAAFVVLCFAHVAPAAGSGEEKAAVLAAGKDEVPAVGANDLPATDKNEAPATGREDAPPVGKDAVPTTGKNEVPAIGRDAVWNTDRQTVQAARQKCADSGSSRIEECFADAMRSFGASEEAVSFTRSCGQGAYVRRFRQVGRVDVAYVAYPFRANENQGILLVNGKPSVVDVDDMASLPRQDMEQDKTYLNLRKTFPRITLWPGDRSGKFPIVDFLPDGGQTFVVPYTLRNFCHACEILGTAFFHFDFDKNGRLAAIRFQNIELPPKKPAPKVESPRENEQIRFVVLVEEGKEFTVRLGSNQTTGYRWRPLGTLDERTVRFVRSQYTPFEGGGVGSGGEESWTFLAVGRGDAEITMEYVRPWEKASSAVKTATIKVWVKPASQR